ncbi:hypothetical protein D2Q93_09215 [Alicyclobacillaceae bacterium I2511]|nr:hypothetical protein D2Q93_09215 [Alicyclobacillaceae bacterium I2511]
MKKYLFQSAVVMIALALVGCGAKPHSVGGTQFYNHWDGYGYVSKNQTINSSFAITGSVTNFSYMLKSDAPAIINSFSFNGGKSDPWWTMDVTWSLNNIGYVNLNPFSVTLSSSNKKVYLSLGKWHIDVIQPVKDYPLKISRQSLGETLIEMPSNYPFSIQLTAKQPVDMKTFSLLTNVTPNILQVKVQNITQKGNGVDIHGNIAFRDRSNQIYLIPALAYTSKGIKYTQPLWPMEFAVIPSQSTKTYAESIKLP